MNNQLGPKLDSAEFRHSIKESRNAISRYRYSQSPAYARIRLRKEIGAGDFQLSEIFFSRIESLRATQVKNLSPDIGDFGYTKTDNKNEKISVDNGIDRIINAKSTLETKTEAAAEVPTRALLRRVGFRISSFFESFQVMVLGVREPLLILTFFIILLLTLGSLLFLLVIINHYTPR